MDDDARAGVGDDEPQIFGFGKSAGERKADTGSRGIGTATDEDPVRVDGHVTLIGDRDDCAGADPGGGESDSSPAVGQGIVEEHVEDLANRSGARVDPRQVRFRVDFEATASRN